MTPTKQFSALLYALANQVRNRQAVMIPPERIEDAAERLDTLTVTIRGLEIERDEWIACHARIYKQRDELLAALIALRKRHQIDDPHHAYLCEFCKQADCAIKNANGEKS